MTRRGSRWLVILMAAAVLFVASTTLTLAKTSVKKVVYRGSGKVTVYYSKSVKYDDVSVHVIDSSKKSYTASITSKYSDRILFTIKSYKSGKTYKVTVEGLDSGDATCSFKIYSKTKAVSIAKAKAKKDWKVSAFSSVSSKGSTYKNTAVWKVTFKAKGFNYTYMVAQQTGKIIYYSRKQA